MQFSCNIDQSHYFMYNGIMRFVFAGIILLAASIIILHLLGVIKFVHAAESVNLFGTAEFKRPVSSLQGWIDVIERNKNNPVFQPDNHFNAKTTWKQLKNRTNGKSEKEQLKIVNSFWNESPYIDDFTNWMQDDYWEIPKEFIEKSGDCEGYAIVKYFTLKELGFNPEKMRIVIIKDTVRNLAHAVLAVYLDDDAFILDNLSNAILSHKQIKNYSPQYSINEDTRWAHIKGQKK